MPSRRTARLSERWSNLHGESVRFGDLLHLRERIHAEAYAEAAPDLKVHEADRAALHRRRERHQHLTALAALLAVRAPYRHRGAAATALFQSADLRAAQGVGRPSRLARALLLSLRRAAALNLGPVLPPEASYACKRRRLGKPQVLRAANVSNSERLPQSCKSFEAVLEGRNAKDVRR